MKIPPFASGPATSGQDYMTKAGAQKLAAAITAAWAKAGHEVPAVVVMNRAAKMEGHETYTVIMPTLRNGLPQ